MADGIPYVPLDCHFDDDKIPMIEAEFGLVGFAIVVKLFQKIYGGLGYYCEWSERVALLFARQIGAGGDVVREVVAASIREGIFNKGMFEKYGILTSRGIQKRFMNVAKRRKQIFNKPEYVLVNNADFSEDVDISSENVCNSGENVCNSATSKVKGSKVNVSEGNGSKSASPTAAPSVITRETLVEKYGERVICDYELRVRDWYARNNRTVFNLYSTIAKWINKDGVKPDTEKSSFDIDKVVDDLKRQNRRKNE